MRGHCITSTSQIAKTTKGRHTLSYTSGLPIVLLRTTGAKSKLPRTVPLVGMPVDGGLAIIASNFGQTRHPAWYYNLRANPAAEASVDGRQHESHRGRGGG